jgi:hypothetical protein
MNELKLLMRGIDIYCSRIISNENISIALKRTFPDLKFSLMKFSENTSEKAESLNTTQAFFWTEIFEKSNKFLFKINIETAGKKQRNTAFLALCQDLSTSNQMKCFCEYIDPTDTNNPYCSVLFDNGAGFLVSDENFEDQEHLEIIRPFKLDQ